MAYQIFVINPGSTSTKIAWYQNDKVKWNENIGHKQSEINLFKEIEDQFSYRKNFILQAIKNKKEDVRSLDFVMGRGGLIKPVPSGIYKINEAMKNDLRNGFSGKHASNLGGLLAADIAELAGIEDGAYIADPVVVDEMEEIAKITGHPLFRRKSIFHALNHKMTARNYAKSIGKPYADLRLIVAHLGGGITIAVHKNGRVVDVNNGLNGDGPMSPERSGRLPNGELVKMCFSGYYKKEEIDGMITGRGGLVAYFGTSNLNEITQKAERGHKKAQTILEVMTYNIAKEIGALSATMKGQIDAILITGGMAHSDYLMDKLKEYICFLAPIHIFPGEDEMQALAENSLLVLEGKVEPKEYN